VIWPLGLCAPRQKMYVSRHFGDGFEAFRAVQIEPNCACWKALPVYFPIEVEFLDLDAISPSQTLIS